MLGIKNSSSGKAGDPYWKLAEGEQRREPSKRQEIRRFNTLKCHRSQRKKVLEKMKWLPESSIRGGLRKISNEEKKISKFYDLQLYGFWRAMQKSS